MKQYDQLLVSRWNTYHMLLWVRIVIISDIYYFAIIILIDSEI